MGGDTTTGFPVISAVDLLKASPLGKSGVIDAVTFPVPPTQVIGFFTPTS